MDKKNSGSKHKIRHWNLVALYLAAYDAVVVNIAFFVALWLRFECRFSLIPSIYFTSFLHFTPVYTLMCLVVFVIMRLYRSIWQFASFSELIRMTIATAITGVIQVGVTRLLWKTVPALGIVRMPLSYYALGITIQFLLTVAIRFSYRFILLLRDLRDKTDASVTRVMLVGAGKAGQLILHNLNQARDLREQVCCIIDDNPNKWNRYIDGVPVVGGRDDILKAVKTHRVEKIVIAIPSATPEQKRDLLSICKETGCTLKNLPDVYRFMTGELSVLSALQDVSMEDLLGRKPIKTNLDEIFQFLRGKTILVTGGGGSIGSELCRQIAAHSPGRLIIFDMYENNAYDIENELRREYPKLDLIVLIGSVRDSARINQVFEIYKPDVVYHAAAHKHVPLMETSPHEAIKNNVFGTYKTAYAAMRNGCKRFVLISTDKAVNPTNIMGASKRLCEMVIQSFDKMIKDHRENEIPAMHAHKPSAFPHEQEPVSTRMELVAVRFGNVLGSNGSVIPLFKKQIEEGGPVTVTHRDIVRYFMTIPEAVSLVLQAGTYARGGEIFVLDMGEPVKIDTLARNLIKLAGLEPDKDIKIAYTGLRPGEKLYEEKLMDEEGLRTTPNKLIHIGKPIPFEVEPFFEQLEQLLLASYQERPDLRELVAQVVTTYHPETCKNK